MASLHTWYRYEQMECWDLSTFCWRNSYSVACSFQLSSIFLLNLYGHSKFEMKIIAWSDEGSLTFTVFSIIFGSHDICSQSLPWDRNMNDLQFRNPKLVRSYPVFYEDALNLYHIHHLTRWPCVVYIKDISYFGVSFFIVAAKQKPRLLMALFYTYGYWKAL